MKQDYYLQSGAVQLYHDNALRLQTTDTGVDITDDLNVAGVSTFTRDVTFQRNAYLGELDKIHFYTTNNKNLW